MVLVHGLASSSVTFQNVFPLIEDHHEVIALDLLGFGGSPIVDDLDYTIDDHVGALVAAIRRLRLAGPAVLVGHSMGALFVARIAARHPHLVSRLVLVSPPIYVSPAELSNPIDRGVMAAYLAAYRYVREHREFTLRNARIVEGFLRIPKAMDINAATWEPFVKSLQNSIETQTTLSDIAAVQAPVEIVYGTLDEFQSRGAMLIAARMRGVTVHKVVGSDHLIGAALARATAAAIG